MTDDGKPGASLPLVDEPEPGSEPVQETKSRRPPWPTVATVVGSIFVIWALSIGLASLSDNSFFTHLVTGRLLVDGTFPRDDIYSFTAHGEPWVVQSWLASLIYGWVDSGFGLVGIRVLTGLLTATIAGLAWLLTRSARTLLPRVVITALVVAIGSTMWAPRPLLFGLVLLCVALLCADGRVPAPVMVPLFWFWANLHGSFPLGLVALACLAIGAKLDGEDPTRELKALMWAAIGTVLGVLSPLGPQVLLFPIRLLGRQDVLQLVVEWQSPSFSDTWTRIFLLQVVVAIVFLVRKPSYRVAIPLVVFTAAALLGLRNVAVASLVLAPGMAVTMSGLGSVDGKETGRFARIGLVLAAVAALVVGSLSLQGPDLDLEAYPVDAVAWMDQAGLRSPDINVATAETVGNFLELVDGRHARVFIDDRVDMYPDAVVNDFLVLLRGQPGWSEVLDRRAVDVVLWDRQAPLTQLLSADPDWKTGYTDVSWTVLCRRQVPNC